MPNGFTYLGLALALLGPGVLAALTRYAAPTPLPLSVSVFSLSAFAGLVAAVAALALVGEGLGRAEIGFGRMSWLTLPSAVVLALFLIFVYGPLAYQALAGLGIGGFDSGQNMLAGLPTWYLVLVVIIVAGGEEWLYRGYAIERLEALTGSAWAAGGISLLVFGLAHVPVWGVGPALSTLVSGGILTGLYLWRRDVSFLILAHVATDLSGLVVATRL